MPISGRSLPQSPAHLSSLNSSSFRSYLNEVQSIASRTCVAARAKDLHVNAHLSWRSVGARQDLPDKTVAGRYHNFRWRNREPLRVLAEKPSVARDIARVLGAQRGDGYLHGGGYVVTWAIGHLAALAQPHEINPEWKPRGGATAADAAARSGRWWSARKPGTVRGCPKDPELAQGPRSGVRTDAAARAELHFPLHLRGRGVRKPVTPSLDLFAHAGGHPRGLISRGPAEDYDPLADAARGRSRADWLVGNGTCPRPTRSRFNEKDLSVGPRADADPGDGGGARTGHPRVRAGGLPRSGGERSTRSVRRGRTYQGTWFPGSR